MIDLFKWGFVLAMGLTWLALGVGALILLMPVKRRTRQSSEAVDYRHAA
jgi:hypothetical protein